MDAVVLCTPCGGVFSIEGHLTEASMREDIDEVPCEVTAFALAPCWQCGAEMIAQMDDPDDGGWLTCSNPHCPNSYGTSERDSGRPFAAIVQEWNTRAKI